MINPELQLIHDTQIVETILGNDHLHKTAQGKISSLTESIKHYVENHLEPDNVVGNLVNILAPGLLATAIGGWFGMLLGLALRVFNIDIYGIFTSIWNALKPPLNSGQQLTSQQVDQAVNGAVQEHAGAIKATSMEDARKWRLALLTYDAEIRNIKTAQRSGFSSLFGGRKSGMAGLLAKILGWVFKVALASAGLMVAGDVINKLVGRPSALDDTIQKGKPVEQQLVPTHISTQTKFKINPNYHEEGFNSGEENWIERYPNNNSGIANMIVNFAKEVYPETSSFTDKIKSLAPFQDLVDDIAWHNHAAAGDPIVFIPRQFKSKKNVVDVFIDELAQATP